MQPEHILSIETAYQDILCLAVLYSLLAYFGIAPGLIK